MVYEIFHLLFVLLVGSVLGWQSKCRPLCSRCPGFLFGIGGLSSLRFRVVGSLEWLGAGSGAVAAS
jgi:hypothetical protein